MKPFSTGCDQLEYQMQTKDRQTEHWLFGPISRQKAKISQLVIASIAINIFALISAFYILTVYDRVIPNETTDSLIYLTAGMVAVIIFDFLMKVIRGVLTDEAGIEVDKEVADSLFNHLSRNENFIGTKTTGSISTTVKEFDSLKDIMASATLVALADLPFILIFLVVLYLIGGPIAAVPALIVVFVIVVGLLIQPVIRKMSASAANDGKSKQSVLIEMLSGLETLKTLKGIPIIKNRWTDSVKNQGEVLLKSRFWTQFLTNIAQSGQQVSQVGIIVYGVLLIMKADLTMGALIACVILSGRTLAPLGQITNILGRLNQALVSYKSLNSLFSEISKEKKANLQLRRDEIESSYIFKNAELLYPEATKTSLICESLTIKPGEKVALLGKIGSGKTTLLRSMSGLISANKGVIKLGGVDINHVHPDDLRKNVAICLQTPLLFSGTLKENILLGNPDATDEEIMHYSKMTGVDEIANNMPDGFASLINERGDVLSGGQRQAISITRTLITEPNILLLDEPTSSMDPQTEKFVLKNIKNWMKNKTVVIATHRGQILDLVERVIILDSGKLVADGKKEEILKNISK